MNWKTDAELFALVHRELFTVLWEDVMDKFHFQHQFLPPQIQPLQRDMIVIGGPCRSSRWMFLKKKVSGTANKLMEKPFGLMLETWNDPSLHEIYLNTGSSPRNALWEN